MSLNRMNLEKNNLFSKKIMSKYISIDEKGRYFVVDYDIRLDELRLLYCRVIKVSTLLVI